MYAWPSEIATVATLCRDDYVGWCSLYSACNIPFTCLCTLHACLAISFTILYGLPCTAIPTSSDFYEIFLLLVIVLVPYMIKLSHAATLHSIFQHAH